MPLGTKSKGGKRWNIYVNDVPVKSNYKVKANDVITVLFEHPPYEFLLVPENIPLDIVHEDSQIIVVNKPAGMVVHPRSWQLQRHLNQCAGFHFENLPENSSGRPGLVHRIDKDTSGLLVIAKTEEAMTISPSSFFTKLQSGNTSPGLGGNVEADQGTIEGAIGRHPKTVCRTWFWGRRCRSKGKSRSYPLQSFRALWLRDVGFLQVGDRANAPDAGTPEILGAPFSMTNGMGVTKCWKEPTSQIQTVCGKLF